MAWTSPRTWVATETLTAALLNTHVRDNLKAIGDAWPAYTPTWTAAGGNPTLGNGTLTGAYIEVGKLIHWRFRLVFGSTTAVGSGAYSFTLPVAPDAELVNGPVGIVIGRLTGGSTNDGTCRFTSGTTFDIKHEGNAFTHNTPLVWASGSTIVGSGTYEAA